jgi:hypothetical protein
VTGQVLGVHFFHCDVLLYAGGPNRKRNAMSHSLLELLAAAVTLSALAIEPAIMAATHDAEKP